MSDEASPDVWDWDDLWARMNRVLWCLAPHDFQRFAHRDICFAVTMQDLLAAVHDALDPDADLSVWLRDEYVEDGDT